MNTDKLKKLSVAYECAINYDAVPDKYEAGELLEFMLPKSIVISEIALQDVLDEYEGWSPDNIINEIINTIDD